MSNVTQLPQWQALLQHYQELAPLHMRDLFRTNPQRFNDFSLSAADLLLDFSKNRITTKTLSLFDELLTTIKLKNQIEDMFTGKAVNTTENRPALHTALRNQSNTPVLVDNQDIMPMINANLSNMRNFVNNIHNNPTITDIVNIGVGGSDLGPALVSDALAPYAINQLRMHFVSNIDSAHIMRTLNKLKPKNTLFIISSKSFGTQETITNANTAKKWFIEKDGKNWEQHFVAVTNNKTRAGNFGFKSEYIFPVWEWVGGRYSLWSAIGLPIALSIGMDNFMELLTGAYAMDQHFRTAPFTQNMPVILAILSVWYINFFGAHVQAILPYDQHLALLPTYLQQAEMESTGKQIRRNGEPVNYATGPVIFGVAGTNGQHAFYQLMHQGTQMIPADFIVAANSHYPIDNHHAMLFANALSQSKALMEGKTVEEAQQELLQQGLTERQIKQLISHKILPGNQPSNLLVMPKLTPRTLGALIALYEHKIYVQSIIWDINAFDQWSVELGKQLANNIIPCLNKVENNPTLEASTAGLIEYYRKFHN